MAARTRYDAIVIGGGHNGLTAAAYLARGGCDVLVLERREVLGGATLTEEPFPGFRYSVFSYLVSLLRPEVIHELDLVRHGLWIQSTESTLNPLPGGDELYREADPYRTYHNIARHSRRDAEALPEFKLAMTQLARLVHRLQDTAPRDLLGREVAGAESLNAVEQGELASDLARHFLDAPRDQLLLFARVMTMSAADLVDRWFESDVLKAALTTSSIIGSFVAPRSPGSAYVLLHHYMGEVDGDYRGWGFQKGGTGQVAETIANAARAHGAEIRVGAPVEQVLVEHGRACGVALADGTELHADLVASSCTPQVTFRRLVPAGHLPEDLLARVDQWQSQGCSGKVNLSLSELPRFASRPDPGPHLAGGMSIAPSIDYVERAFDDCKEGRFSRRPFVDLVIPTVFDRDMAPPGQHVLSCFVQYAPYDPGPGGWDAHREAFGDAVIDVLGDHIVNLKSSILHRQVLTPVDVERITGITGGNIFHGELSLAQILLNRPAPDASSYRTPLPGYYVCGSASHPGGGISGSPGRLCALRMLADRRTL
jgi:phytoene dehydrogenase-like protein